MTLRMLDCRFSYRRWGAPVLDGFDYRLPDGLTVLLGANGAGKSTLLRLAAGVAAPRAGTVTLDGIPSHTRRYRGMVAWMPQSIAPVPSLTAREYVAYIGWLKGMNRHDAWTRAAHALTRVELGDLSDTRTTRLSGGQLRRVGVAGALVHGARVLLLDEPTAGMDPRQRRVFRGIVTGLTEAVRVLISTHDVADLVEEADHVAVLDAGRLLHTGTTRSFLAHAPDGTATGRLAEGAYTALLTCAAHG